MEHRLLGRTGLSTGVIGMGTWRTFDVPPNDGQAMQVRRRIVEEALEAGVNLFDSSPMYGHAEQVLSESMGERRKSALLATKVWARSVEEAQQQMRDALAYYGDRVDVYQVHNMSLWQEVLPRLVDLKQQSKVGAVGITHYAHSSFREMRRLMERDDVEVVQIPYNAADRLAERELLPLAEERGLGVIVMSPLGVGRLVQESPPPHELRFLEDYGIRTWAQALLKWVVSDPRVHVTIPATSRPGRMPENAAAGSPPFFGHEERELISQLASRIA